MQSEFEAVRLETSYATYLVSAMISHWTWFSGDKTDRFWDFLAFQTIWYNFHRDLFGLMIKNLADAERSILWTRAEKLAASGDPSRPMMLGWAMVLNGASDRAVPLLKDAIRRGVTDQMAVSLMYEIYIDKNNWKDAEELWIANNRGRGIGGILEESRKWALAAARSGAHDEAMRFWRLGANIDRGYLNGISELARLGLKDRLRSFYRQMAEDDPGSWVPNVALKSLD